MERRKELENEVSRLSDEIQKRISEIRAKPYQKGNKIVFEPAEEFLSKMDELDALKIKLDNVFKELANHY